MNNAATESPWLILRQLDKAGFPGLALDDETTLLASMSNVFVQG